MLRSTRVLIVMPLALAVGIGLCGAAWANGGESMPSSNSSMPDTMASASLTPEEKATMAYNAGVRLIKDADGDLADVAKATDPKKQQKAQDRAKKDFSKAQAKFESAVKLNPNLYQAWNYVGYSKRNLGDYGGALEAYDRALKLNPQYFEAIEYRGHAYLGLNRVGDARQAYLDLFAGNRALADKLLVAMKSWVSIRRSDAQGMDAAAVEDFAKWVDERGSIASNTTGLSPQGALASWR
jgi:tetratricopeptide (TPR) repeat protein